MGGYPPHIQVFFEVKYLYDTNPMNIILFPVFLVVSLEKNQAFSVHSVYFSCFFFGGGPRGNGSTFMPGKKTPNKKKGEKRRFFTTKKAMTIEKCKEKKTNKLCLQPNLPPMPKKSSQSFFCWRPSRLKKRHWEKSFGHPQDVIFPVVSPREDCLFNEK